MMKGKKMPRQEPSIKESLVGGKDQKRQPERRENILPGAILLQ
jgi:hypothetical protein